ncbi:MAG: hypothetical protein RLZ55_1368 [Actinomycetota bacterium]|jgi:cell division protein FtsB
MARVLYTADADPAVAAAQLASLRGRVRELEAEVEQLRAELLARRLDQELRLVTVAPAIVG